MKRMWLTQLRRVLCQVWGLRMCSPHGRWGPDTLWGANLLGPCKEREKLELPQGLSGAHGPLWSCPRGSVGRTAPSGAAPGAQWGARPRLELPQGLSGAQDWGAARAELLQVFSLCSGAGSDAGDVAVWPQMVSQQVAGNLAAGGRAGCSEQQSQGQGFADVSQPGAHRAGWEDARRNAEPNGSGQKGISLRRAGNTGVPVPAAGAQPVPAAPTSAIPAPRGRGVSWDCRVAEQEFACVRVLFALLGWAWVYLRNEPGVAGCQQHLGPSEGSTSPTSERDPTSLQTQQSPGGSGFHGAWTPAWIPVWQEVVWGVVMGSLLILWAFRSPGAGVEGLTLPGGTWGADPRPPLLR
ncbi:uncharacterized protein LOC128853988 [Cuculus canorus]|uniref:uncharacterized protein LOC128853988 n=1 Tax=Cuculus canorus TaxID=55661 RepID=UPI0023AA5001|nr:uncharacterized protein LOC128853988 [Cuculus canorus]